MLASYVSQPLVGSLCSEFKLFELTRLALNLVLPNEINAAYKQEFNEEHHKVEHENLS